MSHSCFCFWFGLPSIAGSSLLCAPPPLPHIPSLCACISPCHSCPHILGSPVLSSRISLWNFVHLFPSIPRRKRWDERKTQRKTRQTRRGNPRKSRGLLVKGNTRKINMEMLGVWCSSTVDMWPPAAQISSPIYSWSLPKEDGTSQLIHGDRDFQLCWTKNQDQFRSVKNRDDQCGAQVRLKPSCEKPPLTGFLWSLDPQMGWSSPINAILWAEIKKKWNMKPWKASLFDESLRSFLQTSALSIDHVSAHRPGLTQQKKKGRLKDIKESLVFSRLHSSIQELSTCTKPLALEM